MINAATGDLDLDAVDVVLAAEVCPDAVLRNTARALLADVRKLRVTRDRINQILRDAGIENVLGSAGVADLVQQRDGKDDAVTDALCDRDDARLGHLELAHLGHDPAEWTTCPDPACTALRRKYGTFGDTVPATDPDDWLPPRAVTFAAVAAGLRRISIDAHAVKQVTIMAGAILVEYPEPGAGPYRSMVQSMIRISGTPGHR